MCGLYSSNTFHCRGPIVFFCILCKCSGSLGRCYDGLCKFVDPQFVSHVVGNTGMLCSSSWSGCGRISTGIASGQSTSSATQCGKAGALHSLDSPEGCCIKLSNPCVSSCSLVGSPPSISGSKSGVSICIMSPVFMCWVE